MNITFPGESPEYRVARDRLLRLSELFASGRDSLIVYGSRTPMLNVFHRGADTIRHFWGAELLHAPTEPNQDPRPVGTIEPLWNLFDLIPEGRGIDWDEQLDYSCCDDGTSG
jgi:predicted dithiol-disulfide oxidoreductase (DUF899 family)